MLEVAKNTWTLVGITSSRFGGIHRPFLCSDLSFTEMYSGFQLISLNLPWIRNVIDSYNKLDSYFNMFKCSLFEDTLLFFNRLYFSNLLMAIFNVVIIVIMGGYNDFARNVISMINSIVTMYNCGCAFYQ